MLLGQCICSNRYGFGFYAKIQIIFWTVYATWITGTSCWPSRATMRSDINQRVLFSLWFKSWLMKMNTLFSANIQVLCIFYNFYWTKCELFDEFPVAPTLQKIVWEKLQFLQLCFTVKQTSKKNYFFARDSWQCYLTCTQIEKIGNKFQFRRIFFDGVERNSYSIQHQGQPMSNHSSSQWVTTTPSNKP